MITYTNQVHNKTVKKPYKNIFASSNSMSLKNPREYLSNVVDAHIRTVAYCRSLLFLSLKISYSKFKSLLAFNSFSQMNP